MGPLRTISNDYSDPLTFPLTSAGAPAESMVVVMACTDDRVSISYAKRQKAVLMKGSLLSTAMQPDLQRSSTKTCSIYFT